MECVNFFFSFLFFSPYRYVDGVHIVSSTIQRSQLSVASTDMYTFAKFVELPMSVSYRDHDTMKMASLIWCLQVYFAAIFYLPRAGYWIVLVI